MTKTEQVAKRPNKVWGFIKKHRYFWERLLIALATLVLCSFVTFVLMKMMPGDVVENYTQSLMAQKQLTYDSARRMAVQLLNYDPDEPVLNQLGRFYGGLFRGNLGQSIYINDLTTNDIIAKSLPWTLFISSMGLLFSYVIGTFIGARMAYKRNGVENAVHSTYIVVSSTLPDYLFGLIILYVFAYTLGWFPTYGAYDIETPVGFNFRFIGDCLYHASIEYKMKDVSIRAVNNVTLPIVRGKVTAIVGESGSGKTTLVSAILRNISSPGEVVHGEVLFNSADGNEVKVLHLNKSQLAEYRWKDVSMVFQASQSTLNPTMKIGEQFYETAYYHGCKQSYKEYRPHMEELLEYVKLDPKRVLDSYPHELSGGMKQRVMIAFALLLEPQLIILDEPTTALDVITQYYIFEILAEINRTKGITMILLTHDIGIVARAADYVAVMYAGRLMEYGGVYEVFDQHLHPYANGLIDATPSIVADISKMKAIGGEAPNLLALPEGCVFSPRCPYCSEDCKKAEPLLYRVCEGHYVRCFKYCGVSDVTETE